MKVYEPSFPVIDSLIDPSLPIINTFTASTGSFFPLPVFGSPSQNTFPLPENTNAGKLKPQISSSPFPPSRLLVKNPFCFFPSKIKLKSSKAELIGAFMFSTCFVYFPSAPASASKISKPPIPG